MLENKKIVNSKNIILFGSGVRCKRLCHVIKQSNLKISCVVDNNSDKWGSYVDDFLITSPDMLKTDKEAYVCITILDEDVIEAVRKQLVSQYGFNLNREIRYDNLLMQAYKEVPSVIHMLENSVDEEEKHGVPCFFDCYNGLGLGGIEEWTKAICRQLWKRGWENVKILSKKENESLDKDLEEHVEFFDVVEEDGVTNIIQVLDFLKKSSPCVVITSQINNVLLSAVLLKQAQMSDIRIISVIHGGTDSNYNRYFNLRDYIDEYICVSEDIREALINRGIESGRVFNITCPVKCDNLLERTYSLEGEPLRIGYSGRLELVQKRMDLLLKLIDVLEQKKVNYQFELIGEGSYYNQIVSFVQERRLNNKVKCLGKIDRSEVTAFWKRQDICVNIADYEGRSISIMEAMANGAIPIVTETSGVREDVTDGVNGYIVALRDYKKMADKIEEVDRHRHKLQQMGQLAHDVICPKCQMEDHILFWEEVLQDGNSNRC